MEEFGQLSFVSWVRRGLATGIQRVDGAPQTPLESNTEVPIEVNFQPNDLAAESNITLTGPGDIVGLDSRVVVRVWPGAEENDAESGNLALIEFDQADLPWRYSPAKENAAGQLRPWVNLVVVKESEGNLLPPTPARKIALLNTNTQHLPNLNESWAWAHTQFTGKDFTTSKEAAELAAQEQVSGEPGSLLPA